MLVMVEAAIVAGVAGTLVAALAVWLLGRWRARSVQASSPRAAREARMARDIGVLSELLAERLATIWQADGGPGGGGADTDAAFHYVRESTEQIMRQAGASSKAAIAVGALTAKKVRPGPIREPRSREA